MIQIKNIGKAYGQKIVLDIESLEIKKGEIFGLAGNNGAGKTTLFRLLLDLIKADRGEILSNQLPVDKTEIWKDYTISFLDESFLIDFLTPIEFFYFIGETYGLKKTEVDLKLKYFEKLFNGEILDQKNKYIRDFSKGNKQKIGIVSALITSPEVLVLDEPFNGLDPSSQILLKKILTDINKNTGATIIISSHDLNHISDLCQRIVILEKGKIVRDFVNDGSALTELEKYFNLELNFHDQL
jgi:ABC-2 type transport system ATP-binding protein